MVKRLNEMPEVEANHLWRIECPTYEDTPPLAGKPLSLARTRTERDFAKPCDPDCKTSLGSKSRDD
jgi:hypothetical protein